ncbi:RING-H2 finger protein ATL32 [Smittium culicis]|uniref:RING-type E3 ubiquitin transferase n=1 Tax=Smittium culicis TaxID=133412 RepID=A0A1R1Y104_9FUNG|nr:RING-H2 finger protein ATL32 [Smittium culicis]
MNALSMIVCGILIFLITSKFVKLKNRAREENSEDRIHIVSRQPVREVRGKYSTPVLTQLELDGYKTATLLECISEVQCKDQKINEECKEKEKCELSSESEQKVRALGRKENGNIFENKEAQVVEIRDNRDGEKFDENKEKLSINSQSGPEVVVKCSVELECLICLENIKEEELIRKIPCNHYFHLECMDTWVKTCAGICPTCRFNLHSN